MDYNEAKRMLGKPSHLLGIDPLAQLRRELYEAKKSLNDPRETMQHLDRAEAWATITQHDNAQRIIDAMKNGRYSREDRRN